MTTFNLYCLVLGRITVGIIALMAVALIMFIGIVATETIKIKRNGAKK